MVILKQKITIVKINRPRENNVNEELQWLGSSLGLFSKRDKEGSCFRIFIELLKATKQNKGLTSDEIAYNTHLSRGTVVHHLNKLLDSGIVIHSKNKYFLRVNNLRTLIKEIHEDIDRTCSNLIEVAEEMDRSLGL